MEELKCGTLKFLVGIKKDILKFQIEFEEKNGFGCCFIVAGVLKELYGGNIVLGYYKINSEKAHHWWIKKDGKIIDYNCFNMGLDNVFVYETYDNKSYEEKQEFNNLEEVKSVLESNGRINNKDYDYWFEKLISIIRNENYPTIKIGAGG